MRYIIKDEETESFVASRYGKRDDEAWTFTGPPMSFDTIQDARKFCVDGGLTSGAVRILGTINSGYNHYHAVESHPVIPNPPLLSTLTDDELDAIINALYPAIERVASPERLAALDAYCLKATPEEIILADLALLQEEK